MTESKIKELIMEALANVKESEAVYASLVLNDETVVLGPGSPFDSIGFTNFAVSFEEKFEALSGTEYILEVEELWDHASSLTAAALATAIFQSLDKKLSRS